MTATKIQPGDDTHLTLLMAPHSLNFVTGADRAALLAYGRDVFAAARDSKCLAQIEEPSQPVLYVSPGQLANHSNPEGPESAEAGRYLPARVTQAGKFTQPLYAGAAPADVAGPAWGDQQVHALAIHMAASAPPSHKPRDYDADMAWARSALDFIAGHAPALEAPAAHIQHQGMTIAGNGAAELGKLMREQRDSRLGVYPDGNPNAGLPCAAPWKDHQTARLVNDLRDCAVQFHGAGQLRERIAHLVAPLCDQLKAAQEAPAVDAAGVLLTVIQRLNQNPYSLTKSECIEVVRELRDEAMSAAPAAPAVDALSQAARDVLAERRRQVSAEGFSHARDDQYVGGQLAGAAASYLILAAGGREDEARAFWPWRQEWLKPGSPRRYLEKVGALVLAEMERLDRAAQTKEGGAAC